MKDTKPGMADARTFYDAFMRSRMIGYRLHKNPRVENIKKRVATLVMPKQRILEIGCGIGIVSEFMARKSPAATIYACDLSVENINYARHTIPCRNIAWKVVDITREFQAVMEWLEGPVDLIVLADVIEHIPASQHTHFFNHLRQALRPDGKILLTLPSPQYQRFLATHRPEELQPIDETLDITDLTALATQTGCVIRHYSLEDTGGTRNQYIHCVFDSATGADILPTPHKILLARIYIRTAGFIDHHFFLPFRKQKYISKVLAQTDESVIHPADLNSDISSFNDLSGANTDPCQHLTVPCHKLERIITPYNDDICDKTVLDFGGGAQPYKSMLESICEHYLTISLAEIENESIEHADRCVANVVISYQIIQDVSDPAVHLQKIRQHLADNGLLILCTCRRWHQNPAQSEVDGFSNADLHKLLTLAGFSILSTVGSMYPIACVMQHGKNSLENILPISVRTIFSKHMTKLIEFTDTQSSLVFSENQAQSVMVLARKKSL